MDRKSYYITKVSHVNRTLESEAEKNKSPLLFFLSEFAFRQCVTCQSCSLDLLKSLKSRELADMDFQEFLVTFKSDFCLNNKNMIILHNEKDQDDLRFKYP